MASLIYLVQVCIYTAAFWGLYRLVWHGKTAHGAARMFLLLSMMVPLVLPFVVLDLREQSLPAAWLRAYQLPEIGVGAGNPQPAAGTSAGMLVFLGYALVAAALAGRYLVGYFRILRRIEASGPAAHIGNSAVYTNTGIGPGSLGRRIFFPAAECDPVILNHELAHVRSGHRYDLVLTHLLTTVFWANPFIWILKRELKLRHEFEADAAASQAGDLSEYASLLLSQVFGLSHWAPVHAFFHHPIKQRIVMLQKNQVRPRTAMLFSKAAIGAALVCASILFLQCRREAPESPKSVVVQPSTPVAAVGKPVYKFVDSMPSFSGDLTGYLIQNLRYPEEAKKAGKEGRAVIQFIVGEDGTVREPKVVRSSGTELLDAEALRVVKAMPAWIPGQQAGQAVSVYFTLPVSFRLGS